MHQIDYWLLKETLGDLSDLISKSGAYYNQDPVHRAYHTHYHALEVASQLAKIMPGYRTPIIAALYHDAIYIVGAKNGINEEASAAIAFNDLKGRVSAVEITRIMDLIASTTVSHHMRPHSYTDSMLGALLDADLYSLSVAYDEFISRQRCIIIENSGKYPDDLPKVADFLSRLKNSRAFIYDTEYARSNWEAAAIHNIERLEKEYNGSARNHLV